MESWFVVQNDKIKFINLIDDMYKETTYQIKFQDGLSGPISAIAGVKQGCVLSPLLFKIFLSDLPGIFDSACDPVQLYDTKISCLLYADDLILLSESPNGLQLCLNKLDIYCNKWNLEVNISKTKIMVFNKSGRI